MKAANAVTILGAIVAAIVLWMIIGLVGCATIPPAPTPTGATCATVCAHASSLGCQYDYPTPGGATCEQVCQHSASVGQPWRLECLSQATSCLPTECP